MFIGPVGRRWGQRARGAARRGGVGGGDEDVGKASVSQFGGQPAEADEPGAPGRSRL